MMVSQHVVFDLKFSESHVTMLRCACLGLFSEEISRAAIKVAFDPQLNLRSVFEVSRRYRLCFGSRTVNLSCQDTTRGNSRSDPEFEIREGYFESHLLFV